MAELYTEVCRQTRIIFDLRLRETFFYLEARMSTKDHANWYGNPATSTEVDFLIFKNNAILNGKSGFLPIIEHRRELDLLNPNTLADFLESCKRAKDEFARVGVESTPIYNPEYHLNPSFNPTKMLWSDLRNGRWEIQKPYFEYQDFTLSSDCSQLLGQPVVPSEDSYFSEHGIYRDVILRYFSKLDAEVHTTSRTITSVTDPYEDGKVLTFTVRNVQ